MLVPNDFLAPPNHAMLQFFGGWIFSSRIELSDRAQRL